MYNRVAAAREGDGEGEGRESASGMDSAHGQWVCTDNSRQESQSRVSQRTKEDKKKTENRLCGVYLMPAGSSFLKMYILS